MDEQNSLGQGINALIPPKNNQEPSEGALEEKISEKLNSTFSNFPIPADFPPYCSAIISALY